MLDSTIKDDPAAATAGIPRPHVEPEGIAGGEGNGDNTPAAGAGIKRENLGVRISVELKQKTAKRAGSTRNIPAHVRYSLLDKAKGRCSDCGRTVDDDGIVLHIDHIIPVCQGGSNNPDNLRVVCAACNLGKVTHDKRDKPKKRVKPEDYVKPKDIAPAKKIPKRRAHFDT